ncbi:hypothetical protein HPT29_025915 (plasmid) [Microvirga terrae]|uniref:Uncharacterized protein n=1 Tax=Microvirga terrae TaxID=2740529 RepID=A0ABY5S240_9HYPH|nr:hypothetical protein [Microvirga terrae]UVF22579.1 hypothetical protein HPT29_025915 [Microvirga terrae]
MPHTVLIDNHRHPQRAAHQTLLDEALAFYKLEVLAVAVAVLGEVPVILDASMLHVSHRLDCGVDLLRDLSQQSQPSS